MLHHMLSEPFHHRSSSGYASQVLLRLTPIDHRSVVRLWHFAFGPNTRSLGEIKADLLQNS